MADLRTLWKQTLRVPALAFLFSRCVVGALLLFVSCIELSSIPAIEGTNYHASWRLPGNGLSAKLAQILLSADGNWYMEIAKNGYSHDAGAQAPKNWVFFPLYPLLVRALGAVTGSHFWSGILLSHAALFLALVTVYEIGRRRGNDESTTARAVWLLALFPSTYFLSAFRNDSLFLLLVALWALCLLREKTWGAAIMLGLATATRPTGLFFLPAFALHLYLSRSLFTPGGLGRMLAASSGAILFGSYLHFVAGDALAFMTNQQFWGREPFDLIGAIRHLGSELHRGLVPWNFAWLNLAASALALAAAALLAKEKRLVEALAVALPVLGALQTGTALSLLRFVSVLVPVYFVLAERAAAWERVLFAVFAVLLTLLTVGFALHITPAMT